MRRIVLTLAGAAVLAACGAAGVQHHVRAGHQRRRAASGTTISTDEHIARHRADRLQGLHPLLLPAGEELDARRLHRRLPDDMAAAGGNRSTDRRVAASPGRSPRSRSW